MRTDTQIRLLLEVELLLSPELDATDLDIAVDRGVVILSGHARSEGQKYRIERLAGYIVGEACVANYIAVRPFLVDEKLPLRAVG